LGQTIQVFTYDDNGAGWHPPSDGGGPSLVIVDPTAATSTWNSGSSWRPSHQSGGSPGANDVLPASVVGRRVFYNSSFFDGNNASAKAIDDAAIDTTKSALLPGGSASFANYSGYSRGINGLFIDIASPGGTITASDFDFKVGNNNTPSSWASAGVAPTVSVRTGGGTNGSERVTLIFPDMAIRKTWLQVTVLANANTGLAGNDVFYFGNAIGEVGHTTANAQVNATDEGLIRLNGRNALNPAPVDFRFDIDKNRLVNSTDQALSRLNATSALTALRLIVPPTEAGLAAGAGPGSAVDAALADLSFAAASDGQSASAASRSRSRRRQG
jgi:hypothetical protein